MSSQVTKREIKKLRALPAGRVIVNKILARAPLTRADRNYIKFVRSRGEERGLT